MKAMKIKAEWASLSLAEDGCAVVCTRFNGSAHCVRYDSLDQLCKAIGKRKVSVRKWAVSVPRSSCILKQLTLPASDMAEASKMIEFELPSLVPLNVDELVYCATPLGNQGDMLKVLVCILKEETLNEHLEPFISVGIKPHKIILSSLAIQQWFATFVSVESKPMIGVLANDRKGTVLSFIDDELQRASELHVEVLDVSNSRTIVGEIVRHREELQDLPEDGKGLILAGSTERVCEIDGLLRSTVPEFSSGDDISIVPNPVVFKHSKPTESEDNYDRFSWEAATASGLLKAATSSKLEYANLLPLQFVRKYERKTLLRRYQSTGVLFLVFVLLVWLILVAINWKTERMSRVLQAEIAPIEDTASAVDSKRQRVVAIQRQLSGRGRIVGIIRELYQYTPKSISLNTLSYDSRRDGTHIEIKGQADVLSTAWNYTEAMNEAKLLNGIQISNVQMVPRPGGSVVVFKAHCDIPDD
jgi:hypothetical protein